MSSWRDAILKEFVPGVSRLTLVADPDCLLTEEKLALELRQRGFDLVEFSDAIEFRYAYESRYRAVWDRGEHTDLIVVLRLQGAALDSLPYDLLQAGRSLWFNLGELFPNLSYTVLETLDRSLLDILYAAQRSSLPDRMGDNATRDFVLRHVFGIAAELVANEVDLLRALLRLHYGKQRLPDSLAERLVQVLHTQAHFSHWPLAEIVPDDEAFFAFLQERWMPFLARSGQKRGVREGSGEYFLRFSGPPHLPFDHQDIRVYIDNLFLEGKLNPVEPDGLEVPADSWLQIGIISSAATDNKQRIDRLFERVEQEVPASDARHTEWIEFAQHWAELSSLVHCSNTASNLDRLRATGTKLNSRFADWLEAHYASLTNLPPGNPAMLHHVPRRLARDIEEQGDSRIALVVVDGLALDQWVTLRGLIQQQSSGLVMRESATFAWVPTLTSVSRQAIFSGKSPMFFPASIQTTNNEEKLWKQFWESHGVSRLDVSYQRGLGDGDAVQALDVAIHPDKTRVAGLVVDKVDKIMHGMQLGSAGMHNQIRQWGEGGYLVGLIVHLLDSGFQVWLTSDHGNIQCDGQGRPSEGVIAETRGERARVYPTPELRAQVAADFPFAREWQPVGLPADYYPLLASGHSAFVSPGEVIVGHGGIAVEEVIVPLVKFEWSQH